MSNLQLFIAIIVPIFFNGAMIALVNSNFNSRLSSFETRLEMLTGKVGELSDKVGRLEERTGRS
jgi:hypothetical protein